MTVDKPDEQSDFLSNIVSQELNQIVRQDQTTKGIVTIDVNTDSTFTIKLHRGTENQAQVVDKVDKETLLDLIGEKL